MTICEISMLEQVYYFVLMRSTLICSGLRFSEPAHASVLEVTYVVQECVDTCESLK